MPTKPDPFRTLGLSLVCIVLIGISLFAAQRTQRWMQANHMTKSSTLVQSLVRGNDVHKITPDAPAPPAVQAPSAAPPAPESTTFAEVAPVIIAGGGGRQAGGSYVITGAIGQVGLGVAKKKGFSLDSGFWPAESGNQPGNCASLTIAPTELPEAIVGMPYAQTLTVIPVGVYTFSIEDGGLLSGLTLNAQTGVLSGTPTQKDNAKFTVKVTAANGCTGTQSYKLKAKHGALAAASGTAVDDTVVNVKPVKLPTTVADFDGDGRTDFALWRGASGEWLLPHNVAVSSQGPAPISANPQVERRDDEPSIVTVLGTAQDVLAAADYDGDGKTDPAIFRASAERWLVRSSVSGQLMEYAFGQADDIPVSGDYDGDGRADLAVWRASDGAWHWQRSSDGQPQTIILTELVVRSEDVLVPGDYDGDGKTDAAIFRRERSGRSYWHIHYSSDGRLHSQAWGTADAQPVAADYDGDGKTDLAVWRGNTGDWQILRSSDGQPQFRNWGVTVLGDMPVPGDYDGDGMADLAVWRASEGRWAVLESRTNQVRVDTLGQRGDIPITAMQQR